MFCCSASQAVAENRKAAAANKVNQKVSVSNFQTAATNLVQNLPSGVDQETFLAWLNELGTGHMLFYCNGLTSALSAVVLLLQCRQAISSTMPAAPHSPKVQRAE